jgi:ferredoxin
MNNLIKKANLFKPMRFFTHINYSSSFSFSTSTQENKVNFTFKYLADGTEVKVAGEIGKNILKTAHENKIDIEGACDCSLACSTCHIILDQKIYESIPPAEEVEDDLLDLAFGLTHTSRLGCQVILTKEFEGQIIEIPSATKNLYVDGHKPQPH